MRRKWDDAKPLVADGGIPLSHQIRQAILTKVTSGMLQPGDMLPPEVALARMYKVSRTTIRHAISPLVKDGVLQATRGRGTVVQKRQVTNTKRIALVCPFLIWYALDLIEGIQSAIHPHGLELIIRNSNLNSQLEAQHLAELLEQDISGIIIWPCEDYDVEASEPVQRLLAGKLPFVSIDVPATGRDSVVTHNFGGGYLLGNHLLEHGYTRIGYVGKLQRSTERERLAGLQEAMRSSSVEVDHALVFYQWPDKKAFIDWVVATRPRALCCCNDGTAVRVMSCLTEAGIRIPEEIAVAGYDDNAALVSVMSPPLTSVSQDFQSVGQSAGRLLLEGLTVANHSPRHIVLPVQLSIRRSCGCTDALEQLA